MGQMPTRYRDGEREEFHRLLSQYNVNELQLIYEYFKNDLIYIVASATEFKQLLEYMATRNILNMELYLKIRSDLGPFMFSEKLVQDILDAGKEAIMGFLEAIYDLQFFNAPTHLYALRDELDKFGDSVMQQILLDRNGHPLTPELKEIQEHHKQHLLEIAIPKPSESTEQKCYVSDRYMDLIVSHVRPFHRSANHKLLETAEKHKDYVRPAAGSVSPNRLFSWCQNLRCAPHAVMVTGVPGIGKTTLLEKLVCDWANGKFYQQFSFIFFLRFRDLNKLEKISLESMILQEYPYLENQLGNILENPERLLFIFDGLDESVHEIDFIFGQLPRDIKQVENVGAVVVGLAKQFLLKGCSLLMTSQPDRLAGKDINIFKRALEVIGFLPKESQLYIERFFMNKEISEKVLGFLRENGVLYTFCYNPSYCWIICTVLSKFFKGQSTNDDQMMPSLPKTLTQLFAAFIADVLSKHSLDKIKARSLLTSIGWMAEHEVMNHITKFEKQTLSQFNVDPTSNLFPELMKEYTRSPEASFSFLHPITQEFLAALVHYIDYSPENLESSLKRTKFFKDNYGELFLSFLCGLSDISTRTILEPYLGDFSSDAAEDVLTWLKKEVTEFKTLKKRRLLSICFKFFELQNKEFVLECLGSLRHFNIGQVNLTPLDCSVVSFTIQSFEEIEVLGLGECKLRREDVERFAPALHKIRDIGFNDSRFGDDGVKFICSALKHPDCKIHTLHLGATGLTDRACSYLGPAISANKSLRILRLSCNRLDGPHFGDLMTALSSPACQLEELDLSSTCLADTSCSLLASGIRSNQSLKILILSFNHLTCPYFGDLMEALSSPTCAVEQLMLQGILLDDEHLPLMLPLSNNKNLTYLDLSTNSLTGASTPHLRDLILQSPSLKRVRLGFSPRLLEDGRPLLELEAQRPSLYISVG
ncbi:NACHT, LRR and PYD domains-containing protein 3-like isoform X2 [Rana temporaria]|uniref:NACHT, LRR and PYD domains-containing protein 3-like isoform X2 n=1 Tax=Rana temporaria TaxID=8407 RepID=UPI001AAD1A76|nr:NACHT, LRR and PYD domains-containing protein 3-like isoform X2 [Rana temporaria]